MNLEGPQCSPLTVRRDMTKVTRCSCFLDHHGLLSEVKPSFGLRVWPLGLLSSPLTQYNILCSLSLTELLYTEPPGVLCSWSMKKVV